MTNGKPVIRGFVKGAPDQLLARASSAHGPDGTDCPDRRGPRAVTWPRTSASGPRACASWPPRQRDFDPGTFDPNADLLPLITDLQLLALVGIVDPPRAEARDAIAKAKSAGIRVRMITGDHAITAEAIARQLGIEGRAITGAEFSRDVRRRGRPPHRRHRRHRPGRARRTRSTSSTSSGARATSWR